MVVALPVILAWPLDHGSPSLLGLALHPRARTTVTNNAGRIEPDDSARDHIGLVLFTLVRGSGHLAALPRYSTGQRSRWRSEARETIDALRTFVKLGKAIRAARQAKELTLEELAESAHLSATHLLDIEHGRTNVTLASLVGIARGLGVRLRELFDAI